MGPSEHEALYQIELAEAELAVLKQELVLQHLIVTGEPSDGSRALLERLRRVAEQLTNRQHPTASADSVDPARLTAA
jgi:hypothetical protein